MNRPFLAYCTFAFVLFNPLNVSAQRARFSPVMIEAKSIATAVSDLKIDLNLAMKRVPPDETFRKTWIVVLQCMSSTTAARADHLQDVEILRSLVIRSNDRERLKAADDWLNIRANFILPEIDRSIALVEVAQKNSNDRRTEAAAIELRKQIRRVRQLWQSKKTDELPR